MGTSSAADAMVTARVPRGVKQRGDALLRKLGKSPTKLVNAAYEYLIEHGTLPGADSDKRPQPGRRTMTPEQKKAFTNWLQSVTVVPAGTIPANASYDQLKEAALRDRYPEFFQQSDEVRA